MPGVKMPDESRLPHGAHRDLVTELHGLYGAAGKPSCRQISTLIRQRDDLPGTLSHEGVSAALRGAGGVPRWRNLESLVRVLAAHSVIDIDVETVVIKVHRLWRSADDPTIDPTDPTVEVKSLDASAYSNESIATPDDELAKSNRPDKGEIKEQPDHSGALLARWNPRLSTLDVFDKQTAIDIARSIGGADEKS